MGDQYGCLVPGGEESECEREHAGGGHSGVAGQEQCQRVARPGAVEGREWRAGVEGEARGGDDDERWGAEARHVVGDVFQGLRGGRGRGDDPHPAAVGVFKDLGQVVVEDRDAEPDCPERGR
ncbi:MAG: hypothetical protein JO321_16415 [Solirubrobacterales bacterium]|nr:hypothetical protein [Solirubrobacterales bacterium]